MTKAELLSAIAKKGGYTKKDAEKALDAVIGRPRRRSTSQLRRFRLSRQARLSRTS